MLTLQEILAREEGQTFDRKSINVDAKGLAVAITAMANADGGDIVVGLSDKSRRVEGVDQATEHVNDLLRVPFDYCVPSVQAQVEYIPCADENGHDNHLLVFHISASEKVHANQADEVYLRVGDKNKKLTFEERYTLMSDKGQIHFETAAVKSASLDDIDLTLVEDYISRLHYGKSTIDFLIENRGYLVQKGEYAYPSVVCMLLFGKKPQDFFPRARVRFIRYEGTEEKVGREMNVIKDVTFEGTLRQQIEEAVAYLSTQVREHTFLGPKGLFVTEIEYPEFVRQEIVVNAVCHRDYNIYGTDIQVKMFDDRLVVESPGKLPGMVRPENIRRMHFSRNPLIAQYLKTYTYVKEFGEGVDRMCREMEAQGLRPVKYSQQDFMTLATAYNQSEQKRESAEIEQKPMIETPISGFSGFESADFLSDNGQSNDKKTNVESAGIEVKPMIQGQNSGFSYSIETSPGAESVVSASTDMSRLSVNQILDMAGIRQQLIAANSKKPTIDKIEKLCDSIKVNEVFGSKLVSQILYCSETQARAILIKLKELGLIEPVAKQGKGKYIFKS